MRTNASAHGFSEEVFNAKFDIFKRCSVCLHDYECHANTNEFGPLEPFSDASEKFTLPVYKLRRLAEIWFHNRHKVDIPEMKTSFWYLDYDEIMKAMQEENDGGDDDYDDDDPYFPEVNKECIDHFNSIFEIAVSSGLELMSSHEIGELIKPKTKNTQTVDPNKKSRSALGTHFVKIIRSGFETYKVMGKNLVPHKPKCVSFYVTSQERASLLVDLLFLQNKLDRVNYDATMDEQFNKAVALYAGEDSDPEEPMGNKVLVKLCKIHAEKNANE